MQACENLLEQSFEEFFKLVPIIRDYSLFIFSDEKKIFSVYQFLSFIQAEGLHKVLLSTVKNLLKTKNYADGNKEKRDRYMYKFRKHLFYAFIKDGTKRHLSTKIDFLKLYFKIFQNRILLLQKYKYSKDRSQPQNKKTSVKVAQVGEVVQREVFNAELHNLDFRQMISHLPLTLKEVGDVKEIYRERIVHALRSFSSVAPGEGRIEESCCGVFGCDGSFCGRTYVRTMEHIKYNKTKLEEIHCAIQGILYPDEGPTLK